MKNIYFCIFIILPLISFAQSPCSDTQVTLSSQAEVDAFPSQHCSILCSLTIQGNDITNLDSLYVVRKLGLLNINFNPQLTDIDGLMNLASVEGSCTSSGVIVEGNNMLPNLNGLSGLTNIQGVLRLTSNTMLNDISGLCNLTYVNDVDIENNASLENLDGPGRLTTINGNLTISGNPGLQDLNGLSHVTGVAGEVFVEYSDALTTLDGLSGLTSIGGRLSVLWNPELTSITGLSNLSYVGQFSASGESVSISFNDELASLEGLHGLDTIPGVLTIEGNGSLVDLNGLSALRSLHGPDGESYNSGIRIAGNNSLTDISGISQVEVIDNGRAAYLEIISNQALTTINPLRLTAINGNIAATLRISDNGKLVNIDGLSSLQQVMAGLGATVEMAHNPMLQNIDGLSGLSKVSSSRGGTVTIAYNPMLGRFCGLYTLFHSKGIGCGSPECYDTSGVWFDGNERNPTPEQIEEEGPCDATSTQPTNLVFTQVTSEGMRVKFNRASGFVSGYVVLMRAYGPPAPENVPQDGVSYHVGQVLGHSSIVVHAGADSTFVVSGLVPSTPYYFDVFSFKMSANGNDYLITDPLEGTQATLSQAMFASTLSFMDVTDESMTVMLDKPEQGNYIALMKAYGYPSPNDVPTDGTEYRVGNTIGSSTIVVNIGDGSAFTVNGLMPGMKYYFDIYKYDVASLTYETTRSQGSQATERSGENLRAYPNPFNVTTTIPFVVPDGEQSVQVSIFDSMGREINVLTSGSFVAGRHETSWDGYDRDGRRVGAGVYIYSVKSESGVVTGRVSLR